MAHIAENSKQDRVAPHATFPLAGVHRKIAQMLVDSAGFEDLTEWQQGFVQDIAEKSWDTINEKQWACLGRAIAVAARAERRIAEGRK